MKKGIKRIVAGSILITLQILSLIGGNPEFVISFDNIGIFLFDLIYLLSYFAIGILGVFLLLSGIAANRQFSPGTKAGPSACAASDSNYIYEDPLCATDCSVVNDNGETLTAHDPIIDEGACPDGTPPTQAQPNSRKNKFCKHCGAPIDPSTRTCSGCGRKFANPIKIVLCCSALLLVSVLLFTAIYGITNYHNALRFTAQFDFDKAKQHYDNLLIPDILFPDDYAYVQAGILIQKGSHIEALQDLAAMGDYPVPEFIMSSLKETIYDIGVEAYRDSAFQMASQYFDVIGDYRNADDYRLLLKSRLWDSESLPSKTELDNLFDLIGFEDTTNTILSNKAIAFAFLAGTWRHEELFISVYSDQKLTHNLPYDYENEREYIYYRNGIYATIKFKPIETTNHFRFEINHRNSINIYCYMDDTTYTFCRD